MSELPAQPPAQPPLLCLRLSPAPRCCVAHAAENFLFAGRLDAFSFLPRIDSQPEQADLSAVPLVMHASGQCGRAEPGVVLIIVMAMFC